MSEYYLMHSGRSKRDGAKIGSGRYPLGSGDRPYQATGGKPASKKSRYRPDLSGKTDEELQSAIKRESLENTYAKTFDLYNEPESIGKAVRSSTDATREAIRFAKSVEKKTRPKKEAPDMSKMTDEELRQKVNRYNLERQYATVVANEQEVISEGRAHVIQVLDAAEDVLPFISSAALLALTIHSLTK